MGFVFVRVRLKVQRDAFGSALGDLPNRVGWGGGGEGRLSNSS